MASGKVKVLFDDAYVRACVALRYARTCSSRGSLLQEPEAPVWPGGESRAPAGAGGAGTQGWLDTKDPRGLSPRPAPPAALKDVRYGAGHRCCRCRGQLLQMQVLGTDAAGVGDRCYRC